ncbi:MAG: glycosyltransferase family 4 protein [Cytophagales bacterium]|nr:glycosyltransferase family 4 protein [Cytophagales bacterium]
MTLLWLVSKYPNALNPMDGAFHIDIAEGLAKKGVEMNIIAPVPYIPPFIPALSKKIKTYKKLPYYECRSDIGIYRPRYFGYYKHLYYGAVHKFIYFAVKKIFDRKPDLIHAHFAYPLGMAALQLSRFWNVPYMLTLHRNDVNEYPFYNKRSHNRFKKAILGADEVISVSKPLSERTESLTGRRPKIISIGINLANYENLPNKLVSREKLKLPSGKFIVLYAGHFIKRKGIIELVEAIKTIKRLTPNHPASPPPTGPALREAGGAGRGELSGIFSGFGPLTDVIVSASDVISTRLTPHHMIPLLMSAADLLVLPSYDEGMPTVLIEAGAAYLPVIGSAVGGITDLLADGRGLLVEPGSVKAIVEAINNVRSDYQSALQRAGKLKKYVEKHYNVDKNAEIIINEYKNIIQND